MTAPAKQHRIVRHPLQAARERFDSFAHLASARLRGAERDVACLVTGIGRERRRSARHGTSVALRSVLDTGGGAVLRGLRCERLYRECRGGKGDGEAQWTNRHDTAPGEGTVRGEGGNCGTGADLPSYRTGNAEDTIGRRYVHTFIRSYVRTFSHSHPRPLSLPAGVIILYCVATVIAVTSSRFRVPYTVALLLGGVALGATHLVPLPHLTRELLFAVFLPGLLFEAAYHLEIRELRENSWTISALAIPGVVAAVGLTAAFVVLASRLGAGTPLDWTTGLLFGAVIAATDPVAVTALFRELGAPRRLHVLIESESLLNDGTSIVFLALLLEYLAGTSPTMMSLAGGFLRIALGGAAVGIAIGWGVAHLRTRVEDATIEITLTTIAAYGSFVAAESLLCSGVIATVAAGVMCGHSGRHHALTAGSRAAVKGFWEWLAFALNSAVFILLGTELSGTALRSEWRLVLVAALAALAARAIVVGGTGALLSRTHERMPVTWLPVLAWGGLRGALSLVLAFSLPADVGNRPLIIAMTAGTVVLSLVGQGGTMPWLLRRLRLVGPAEEQRN